MRVLVSAVCIKPAADSYNCMLEAYAPTLAYVNEVMMNDNNENDNAMSNVSQSARSRGYIELNWQKNRCNNLTKVEMIGQRRRFLV